jgi:hypothetical protein
MIEFANVDHYIYEGKNRERSPPENSRVFAEISTSPRAGRALGLAAAAPTHRSRRGSCVRGRCRGSLRSGRSRFRCRGGGLFRRTGAKNYPESRQGNSENQFFHDRLIIRPGVLMCQAYTPVGAAPATRHGEQASGTQGRLIRELRVDR